MSEPLQTVFISVGHLLKDDLNYGTAVECYVCSKPHKARDLARIENNGEVIDVPLCKRCAHGNNNAIARKYLNAPDLKIKEAGRWDPAWDKPQ